MKKIIAILMTGLLFSSAAYSASISIEDAWVREAPPGVKVLAAYMTINNSGEGKDTLVSIESNCCSSVEIHQSLVKDGQAKMIERKSLLLPAERNIYLKQGGLHLMLINPKRFYRAKLRDGYEIEMTFNFANHDPITTMVKIKKVTGGEDHSNHHMHH